MDPMGMHLIEACGKLLLLDKLLQRLHERGHRVLIFSQVRYVPGRERQLTDAPPPPPSA